MEKLSADGEDLDKQDFLKEWENVLSEEQISRLETSLRKGDFVKICKDIFVTETGALTEGQLYDELNKFIKKEADKQGKDLISLTEGEKNWNLVQQNWELISLGVSTGLAIVGILYKKFRREKYTPRKVVFGTYFKDGKFDFDVIGGIKKEAEKHQVILDLLKYKFLKESNYEKLKALGELEQFVGKKVFIKKVNRLLNLGLGFFKKTEEGMFAYFEKSPLKNNLDAINKLNGKITELNNQITATNDPVLKKELINLKERFKKFKKLISITTDESLENKGIGLVYEINSEIRLLEFNEVTKTEIYALYLEELEKLRKTRAKIQQFKNLNVFLEELLNGNGNFDMDTLYKRNDYETLFKDDVRTLLSEKIDFCKDKTKLEDFFYGLKKRRIKGKIKSAAKLAKFLGEDKKVIKELSDLHKKVFSEGFGEMEIFGKKIDEIDSLEKYILQKFDINDLEQIPNEVEINLMKIERKKFLKAARERGIIRLSKSRLGMKHKFNGHDFEGLKNFFNNSSEFINTFKNWKLLKKLISPKIIL